MTTTDDKDACDRIAAALRAERDRADAAEAVLRKSAACSICIHCRDRARAALSGKESDAE